MCFKTMCLLKLFSNNNKIQIFEYITYEEFYEKFRDTLMPSGVSLNSFKRANRYKRAFVSTVIRPGDYVTIPNP